MLGEEKFSQVVVFGRDGCLAASVSGEAFESVVERTGVLGEDEFARTKREQRRGLTTSRTSSVESQPSNSVQSVHA